MIDLVGRTRKVKEAAKRLALCTTDEKNQALQFIADEVLRSRDEILTANVEDVTAARQAGLSDALVDRLTLTDSRLASNVADLLRVVDLPDPVGEQIEEGHFDNGLVYQKVRVPIGVLAVIYEARPNVTLDVTGLAIKSGNGVILRGGSETIRTNRAISRAISRGLAKSSLPQHCVDLIEDTDRQLVFDLLQLDQFVNMVIPRGGASLHEFCRKNSRIPVITGGIGICHLFVDESADLASAVQVVQNAKVQRPSVCNALDTVLVHRKVAGNFLPQMVMHLSKDGVSFRADPEACDLLKEMTGVDILPAGEADFDTEWLSLVLGLKVVGDLDEAIEHIAQHSTGHSDGILTSDPENRDKFIRSVDSAVVYVNASTRFTDGGQLGLGAEVAVSTQRLHARGPMALRELTTYKWVVEGNYHVRP